MRRTVSRISAVVAMTVLVGCSGSDGGPSVPSVTLQSIALTPATGMVAVGDLIAFTAEATYSDGTIEDVTRSAVWASDDDSVLVRRANSEFRGVSEGSVQVSATVMDGDNSVQGTASVTVTPSPITALQVTPTTVSLEVNADAQLTAIGTFLTGATETVTDAVEWRTSDATIATVSAGRVTGVAPGGVQITAVAGDVTAAATVTVNVPRIVDIAIEGPAGSLPAGATRQLAAVATLSSGSTTAVTADVNWTSSAVAIVTVGSGDMDPGLLTALREGESTISVQHPPTGLSATRTVRVAAASLQRVDVSPRAAEAASGDFVFLAAVGVFSDGSTQDFTRTVRWASSDTAVATVSNQGLDRGRVVAVAAGQATIFVVDEESGISSEDSGTSAIITVTPPVLRSLQVEPQTGETPAGRTFQFGARGNYSDGSTRVLTDVVEWSSNSMRATVDPTGLATGVAAGTAQIAVRDPVTGMTSGALSADLTIAPAVIEGIEIIPLDEALVVGDLRQVDAIGSFSDGSTRNVQNILGWQSSDPTVVIASSGGNLRAVSVGTATVTATDFSTMTSAQVLVSVIALQMVSIDIVPSRLLIPPGAEVPIRVEARFNNGAIEDVTETITYANTNPTVADRGTSGNRANRVFALAAGTTRLTASDGMSGLFGTLDMTVTSTLALQTVAVTAPSTTVFVGVDDQFRALGTFDNGEVYDLTHAVTWSSSDALRATVSDMSDSAGIVTGVAIGTATITAATGVVSPPFVVQVRPPVATGQWNGPTVSVDGTGTSYVDVGSVTFTAAQFGTNASISDVDITVDLLKTLGSCGAPIAGCPRHWDIGLRLVAQNGTPATVELAPINTWSGCTTMANAVQVTFDDDAASRPSVTPVTGTFRPSGQLSSFNGRNPVGTWVLQALNRFSARPLCINNYAVTIRGR